MNDALLKQIKENDLTFKEWLKMRVTQEYEKALMNKIDELQSNWNSLREWIKDNYKENIIVGRVVYLDELLDKMNELEGDNNE